MTEYTDKTGATVQVERSTTDEMFEIREPGGEVAGHADFRERDGERIFHHTEVGEEFGGRGLGTALVRGAVEATRAEGTTIVPVCPMVKGFLEKNDDEFGGAYRLPTPDDLAWLRGGDS
ncbi:MAG TPA: N-acetyltransferase [Candidatus Dietzia intestinipullorum]|nr:N-acetyltransferase [Candidatus Dietzia intestinipullorum]